MKIKKNEFVAKPTKKVYPETSVEQILFPFLHAITSTNI